MLNHWAHHARQWARLASPLRPSAEDVGFFAAAVPPDARVLLLGVTPELAPLARRSLVAIDRSAAMIAAVFPRAAMTIPHATVVGDWIALPLADASIDVALGDGCLANLPYPAGYAALATELARVVAPGGRLVLRLFAAPAPRESLADVAAALAAGTIRSIHALKWRVAMATPHGANLAVTEILAAFARLAPDRAALADATGWTADAIATLDAYRGSALVYSFPTEAEAIDALAPHFSPIARAVAGYELAERCPTITFTRRAR